MTHIPQFFKKWFFGYGLRNIDKGYESTRDILAVTTEECMLVAYRAYKRGKDEVDKSRQGKKRVT